MRVKESRVFLANWLADLQARGRYTFTREEALREGGVGERKALWRAQRAKQVAQPGRGFYVIVPPE